MGKLIYDEKDSTTLIDEEDGTRWCAACLLSVSNGIDCPEHSYPDELDDDRESSYNYHFGNRGSK